MRRATVLALAVGFGLGLGTNALGADLGDVAIHGFLTQSYLKSSYNNFLTLNTEKGSFDFTEAGVNFTYEASDKLRIGAQFYARGLGEQGNLKVVLDWAVGDYRWRDWLGIRVGKVKLPIGLYNDVRDADMARPSILLPQGLYSERLRDLINAYIGGELYGVVPLGPAGDLEYQAYGGTQDLNDAYVIRHFMEQGAVAGLHNLPFPLTNPHYIVDNIKAEMDSLYGLALRWNTPLDGLRFSATFQRTDSHFSNTTTYTGWMDQIPVAFTMSSNSRYRQPYSCTGSVEYLRGKLRLSAEYWVSENQIENQIGGLAYPVPPMRSVEKPEAYYGQIAYRVTEWLQLSGYYSEYYVDRDDKEGKGMVAQGRNDFEAWQKDTSLTARFDLSPHWLVKLETHFFDGAAILSSLDNPDGFERNWTMFLARATFHF